MVLFAFACLFWAAHLIQYFYSVMDKRKNALKLKPLLNIQPSQSSKNSKNDQLMTEQDFRNEVALRPLSSAKNHGEAKRYDFTAKNVQAITTERKLRKLKKLQLQKQDLMRSLHILKVGAISAIAEKEQEIQKLKQKQFASQEQKIQYYQKQLQSSNFHKQQLQEERQYLINEMQEQKMRYITQIQQKQKNIEELIGQLNQTRRQIYRLQRLDEMKNKQIKALEQQNLNLSQQLEMSYLSNSKYTTTDLDETIKFNLNGSVASSIPVRQYSIHMSDSIQSQQNMIDYSHFSEKIKLLEKDHMEEIKELKNYYDTRINSIKELYEREFRLKTEENQKTLSRCGSGAKYSVERSLELSQSRKELIKFTQPDEIDLKKDIWHNLKDDIQINRIDTLSNHKKLFSNEQSQSQFTTKYFEYPVKFMKKNKSIGSIISKPIADDSSTSNMENNENIQNNENPQKRLNTSKDSQSSKSSWKGGVMFALGMIAGGSLATFIPKFFNR